MAFRVICGGNTPDHVTIAEFRKAFPGAVGRFFAEVLALCARLGMGKLGVVALDGMKIAASASKSANRTEERLAKLAAETVARHGETDAAEDDLFGAGKSGDEVPEDAWSPRRRDQRIAAALAGLRAEREAAQARRDADAQAYLQAAAAGPAPRGAVPAAARVQAAQLRLERAETAQRAKVAAWQGRRAAEDEAGIKPGPGGKPPLPPEARFKVQKARAALEQAQARAAEAERKAAAQDKDRKEPVRNVTDPHSRLMPVRGGGFIPGYNTQNVDSEDGLIIATELTDDTTDAEWLEPMMRQAEDAAALITAHRAAAGHDTSGGTPASPGSDDAPAPGYRPPPPGGPDTGPPAGPIGLFLADAGYCSEANINAPGPPRLIATGKLRDLEKAARNGDGDLPWASPVLAAMAALLQTPDGIAAYRQRGHIAETPHGNIKHNMRFRQLSVRGNPQSRRRMDIRRRRPEPVQSHHRRPPHHRSPQPPEPPGRLPAHRPGRPRLTTRARPGTTGRPQACTPAAGNSASPRNRTRTRIPEQPAEGNK